MKLKRRAILVATMLLSGCAIFNNEIIKTDEDIGKEYDCSHIPLREAFIINGERVCFDPKELEIYVGEKLVIPYDSDFNEHSKSLSVLIKKIFIPEELQLISPIISNQ